MIYQLISITTKRNKEQIQVLCEKKDKRYLKLLLQANHRDTKRVKYEVRAKEKIIGKES